MGSRICVGAQSGCHVHESYTLWYLWAIRHLDGQPYKQPECPVFLKEHLWVMEPDSEYWGDKK